MRKNVAQGVLAGIRTMTRSNFFCPLKGLNLPGILETKPLETNPAADTEVHTVLCSKDVLRYLFAVKSLLRFHENFSIVVHNDNSLTDEDKARLKSHVLGIKIIEKWSADGRIYDLLENKMRCLEFRKKNKMGIQLFDYFLLSQEKKIVSLDSDTLFFGYPERLVDWTRNGKKELIHLYEYWPNTQNQVFGKLGYEHQKHLCAGFLCGDTGLIDLDVIEDFLSKTELTWWTGQNTFSLLFKKKSGDYEVSHFDSELYQDRSFFKGGEYVFRHYWGSKGYDREYCQDAKRVLRELRYL
jgi:hypothetical protein